MTYGENYPTTNLEAQACGTPCLTYRTGGSVESVPEENIIERGDLYALADKIRVIASYTNKTRYIKNSDMSKENSYIEYMKVYREIETDKVQKNG